MRYFLKLLARSDRITTKLNARYCSEACYDRKCLKVAIIGVPNAGKSTLINQIITRRVFPISKKVHTTRIRAKAVYVEGDTQLVFLDTPGLITSNEFKKYQLHSDFLVGGEEAINEADVIGVVHDLSNSFTRGQLDPKVLRLLCLFRHKYSFLVMNKMDTLGAKTSLLELTNQLTGGIVKRAPIPEPVRLSETQVSNMVKGLKNWPNFNDVFMVSALFGEGTKAIRSYLLRMARLSEWIFSEDEFTDQTPVQMIEDTVRSRLLEYLPEEVPYGVTVQVEYLDMDNKDKLVTVVQLTCKLPKHGKLILGHKGRRIKTIAWEAEQALSQTFKRDVHVRLALDNSVRSGKQAKHV